MDLRRYWTPAAVIIITITAFWLRMYRLDWQCLMVDELVTQAVASNTTVSTIRWSLSVDYNPPLYYLLAHWSSMAFHGITNFSLRFPAVIFGTASIPVIYMVGREVHGDTLGILSASCATVMFPLFLYSQNARAYSLVMFAFLCFTWFWIKLYRDRNMEMKYWVSTGFFIALCLWSHYFALVPISVMMILLIWEYCDTGFLASLTAGILLSPILLLFNLHQISTRVDHNSFAVFWMNPMAIAVTITNEMLGWSWLIVIPLAIYSIFRKSTNVTRVFMLVGFIAPAVLILIAGFTATMPRYALLVAPLVLISAMYPVADYISTTPDINKKIAIFLLVIFSISVLNYGSFVSWTMFSICQYVNATTGSPFLI